MPPSSSSSGSQLGGGCPRAASKLVVARADHEASSRGDRVFVAVYGGGYFPEFPALTCRLQEFDERGAAVAVHEFRREGVHEGHQQCGGGFASVAETEAVRLAEELHF